MHISGATFTDIDFGTEGWAHREYEGCRFINCQTPDQSLAGIQFTDCVWRHCDLSNAGLQQTALRNVHFDHCKLMGLQFDDCNPFLWSVSFAHCLLALASFRGIKMKKTVFNTCVLTEADFTSTDLSGAAFLQCDLSGAVFEQTNLEGADLREAWHFSISPASNKLKQTRFAANNLQGLLAHLNIRIE